MGTAGVVRVAGPVGVIGAGGAVGTALVNQLDPVVVGQLRLGGRRAAPLAALAARSASPAEAVRVDVTDPAELDAFCAGCRIVVNCAGPSSQLGSVVADAAAAAGADYVDVGGHALRPGVCSPAPAATRIVLAAGMMPGLTGLLPRYLADGLHAPTRLRAWCGGIERLTPAAAVDVLASLDDGYGQALAAWRDGAPRPRALQVRTDITLPPFPGRVTAYPYLTAEASQLAGALGLAEVDWYNVFPGPLALAALHRLRAAPAPAQCDIPPNLLAECHIVRSGGTPAPPGHIAPNTSAAAELAAAADADLAGRSPYQLILLQLDGMDGTVDRRPITRTLTLRAGDGYRLTAAVAAAAVDAIATGTVPAGVHHAATVLDPKQVLARVHRNGTVTVFRVAETHAAGLVEEGVL